MNFLFLNSARRGWGGNEKWTKLAAESLAGEHLSILAYRDHGIGDRFGIEKVRLPFLMELDPVTITGLVSIIRTRKIDVVIPTKRKDYVLAGIACSIAGGVNILRLGIDRPLRDTALQRLIYGRLADGIIVNAEKIRRTLAVSSWLDTGKIGVIYNGLDLQSLENGSKSPYSKPFGFMIGAAGALIPRKGFDFLIRAFAASSTSWQNTTDAGIVIAGDGPEREKLEQLADSLGIGNRVRFTGHLDNPYPMMLASDIFVSASTSEGLANVLLESMSLHTVPISTFSGGADELITDGKNGYLVRYGDEQRLAEILEHLGMHPEKTALMADQAYQSVTSLFSMERMRRDLIDFCSAIRERRFAA